jgi:magnesium-transporting ATPase (P-type)
MSYSWCVRFLSISLTRVETIIVKRVGDKTPADLLLFHSTDLKVDNSSLTGESEPQERGQNHKGSLSARPVEADNLVRILSYRLTFRLLSSG